MQNWNRWIALAVVSVIIGGTEAAAQLHISTNTRWSTNQILTQSVIIDPGTTLTIDPGVVVQVVFVDLNADQIGDVGIQVNGKLNVLGNSSQRITFQPYQSTNSKSYWTGITINSQIANDSISGLSISNCYYGIKVLSPNVFIQDLQAWDIKTTGVESNAQNVLISWTQIDSCDGTGILNDSNGNSTIQNTIVAYSGRSGICNIDGQLLVTNSIVSNSARSGIINSSGVLTVANCDISGNSLFGILIGGASTSSVTYSTIFGNSIGVQLTEFRFDADSTNCSYEGDPTVAFNNCNIQNNSTTNTIVDPLPYVAILPNWNPGNGPTGTYFQRGPYQIPYGWISRISYSYYAYYSQYLQLNMYNVYSIRDISQTILQQTNTPLQSPFGTSYWATTANAAVNPIAGDKYILDGRFSTNEATGPQIFGMAGFVGTISLKSYGVISNLHTTQYANFESNYWGQILGIDTLTHYVETPNIDYSAMQVGPIADAHPSISLSKSVSITNLVSGEALKNRTHVPVIWQSTGSIPYINLDLSTNGGSTWLPIAQSLPNVSQQYSWFNNALGNTTIVLRLYDASDQSTANQVTLSVAPGSVSFSPQLIQFPNRALGDSATASAKIANPLMSQVQVLSLNTAMNSFYPVTTSGMPINPGDSGLVTVRFRPSKLGTLFDSLKVQMSDGSIGSLPISGTCPLPTLTGIPNFLAFGNVVSGYSVPLSFQVMDSSINALCIDSVYTQSKYFGAIINKHLANSGDTILVTASFSPTQSGNAQDTLNLLSNSSPSHVRILLTGTGMAPTIRVSPIQLTVPDTQVGDSTFIALTITDSSNLPLNIYSLTFKSSTFYNRSVYPINIAAFSSANLVIWFRPTQFGTAIDTIHITSNAGMTPVPVIGSSPSPVSQCRIKPSPSKR